MKKLLLFMVLFFCCSNVFSQTFSQRDTLNYYLGQSSVHTIFTYPIQPNQPVYAWRTHTNFDGSPGIHTQTATKIGTTNDQGILTIVVYKLPYDPIHCGWFTHERVAVGSPYNQKSNFLNFTIKVPRIGPLPPWTSMCEDPGFSIYNK